MNELLIPPCPNWYEPYMLACTPDNTLIYAARSDIVIIKDTPKDTPADINLIPKAHFQRITSLCINRNYGQPNKSLVSLGEDKIVKVWDLNTLEKKASHSAHIAHEKVVGAVFAGDDRVISITENGVVVIWNVPNNQTMVLDNMFTFKVNVTTLSSCPHATWLAAFGLKNGLVIVADLRKNGKVLYKLRGHDKPVVSLVWCPVPINIFPKNPNNFVGVKDSIKNTKEATKISSKQSVPHNRHSTQIVVEEATIVTEENELNSVEKTLNDQKSSESDEKLKLFIKEEANLNEETDTQLNLVEDISNNEQNIEEKHLKELGEKDIKEKTEVVHQSQDDPDADLKDIGPTCPKNLILERVDIEQSKEQVVNRNVDQLKTGKKKGDLWKDLKFPDDVESEAGPSDRRDSQPESNFLTECESLKKEILSKVSEKDDIKPEKTEDFLRPKLTPRRNIKKSESEINEHFKPSDNGEDNREVVTDVEKESFFLKENMKKIEASTPMVRHDLEEDDEDSGVNLNKSILESSNSNANNDDIDTEVKAKVEGMEEDTKKNQTTYSSEMELTELKGRGIMENKKRTILGEVDMSLTCDVGRSICVSEEEEPRKEFLLASSAKEGNIYIWRAGTDGRLQTLLTTPNKSVRKNRKPGPPEHIWIVLCWVTPNILLSSSKNAELLQWTLPKPRDSSKEVRVIHKDHHILLFNIASPIKYLTDENWNEQRSGLNAWTVGKDRVLLDTDLGREKKVLSCYHTLGGGVITFATSAVDPNRLAFGTSDGSINILDLSRPHTKSIVTSSIYQKVQARVTALAWHPTQELLLAYGTAEGRVGYVDTSSKSKTPTLFPQFFKSEINKIEWGPQDDTSDLAVYVASENKLVTFSLNKSEQGAKEFDLPDNTQVYTFTWKPDYSLLLISTKAGTLLRYDKDLNLLSTAYLQQKLQQMTWHPDAAISDETVSKYCNWFATLIRGVGCRVYEVQADVENVVFKVDDQQLMTAVAWSPHDGNRLIVGFDEGFANVYDVETESVLYTYISPHFDNIMSLIWSPADADFVITGLLGNKMQIWNVTKYPALSDKEITVMRKKALKAVAKESKDPTDLLAKLDGAEDTEKPKVKPKDVAKTKTILPLFYSAKDSSQAVNDTKKLMEWKKGDQNVEINAGDNKYIDLLQVFGEKKEMIDILNKNETSLKHKGKYNLSTKAALFKGDLASSLKEAIAHKRVDPFIISLCPMVSPKLWQSACETYAQQLLEQPDSDPLEAATYFLLVHKVEEAINVLCENLMFKEALALAKSRLQDGDGAINAIIEKWAKYLQFTGHFEMAANCYVCLEKYEDAAMVLFRRSDVEILKLAIELAEKSENEELIKAVTFRYKAFKEEADKNTNKEEGPQAKEVIKTDTELKETKNLDIVNNVEGKDKVKESECKESKEEAAEEYQGGLLKHQLDKHTKEFKQNEETVDHEGQKNQEDKEVLQKEDPPSGECIQNGGQPEDVDQKECLKNNSQIKTNDSTENNTFGESEYNKYLKQTNVLHEFLEKYYKPKTDESKDRKTNQIGSNLQEPGNNLLMGLESRDKQHCDFQVPQTEGITKSDKNLGCTEKVDGAKMAERPPTENDSDNISLD